MYWLLLPPSANAQRQIDTAGVPWGVAWHNAVCALRAGIETLRGLIC